jgi:Peptidase family S41
VISRLRAQHEGMDCAAIIILTQSKGYFFRSSSRAVLSIPSFDEFGDALNTFDDTIGEFITAAQNAGLTKVVIDLQSNTGGEPLLAISTFKHFFPNIDPFAGSRLRAQNAANVMGNTITSFFDSLATTDPDYEDLAANEWVSSDRLNAEVDPNRNFSSWQEFFGPHEYNGDTFTTTQRYNLSSAVFDISAIDEDGNFTVFGFGSTASASEPPFQPEDIILLSDGLCDSSCTLFLEMMHHEAGVRVVVVGGRPTAGPMQGASGSRGAILYPVDILDANIDFAQQLLNSTDPPSPDTYFLPNRTEENDVYITFASINLRDQIRVGGQTPLQFAYDAADCRLWYTPQTVYNYSALWNSAADAIWNKPSLCIAGSTGFATTGTNETDFVGPAASVSASSSSINVTSNLSSLNTSSIPYLTDLNDGLEDLVSRNFQSLRTCNTVADCGNGGKGQACVAVPTCSHKVCVLTCSPVNAPCGNSGTCRPSQTLKGQRVGSQQVAQGFCEPAPNSGNCANKPISRVKIGPPPPNKQ